MEKKFKFSENPTASKIVYAVVVAILAVTAIVIGIVSAASQKDDTPPVDGDGTSQTPGEGETPNEGGEQTPDDGNTDAETLTFVSPAVGVIAKSHSMELPVFSNTLGAWRIHTGIDICTDEGAEVFAAADGEVSAIYEDAMLGLTVEVLHKGDVKTLYSNLANDGSIAVSVGDTIATGDKIGNVGDTAISELADEAHLHFEVLVNGNSANPLDYISEESKKASLGIE